MTPRLLRIMLLVALLLGGITTLIVVFGRGPKVVPDTGPGEEAIPFPAVRFSDVTDSAGVKFVHVSGAFGNDGWPDVFVTGVGGNRLFRNNGGKRFVDVTASAGVGGPGGWPKTARDFLAHDRPLNWSTSAAWLDYDGDGLLDLFVCNY